MRLGEPFGFFGFLFLGFRGHALDHPPQGFGTSQAVALSQFRRLLDVAGVEMPNQIDQAMHAALTGAAFFIEPTHSCVRSYHTFVRCRHTKLRFPLSYSVIL